MTPQLDLLAPWPSIAPARIGRRQSSLADAVPAYASGSDTSEAAALSMTRDAPLLREDVLRVLARHPEGLTSDEIADELGESPLSVRPRTTELKQDGLIVDTGTRRANRSGRLAAVMRLAA